MSAVTTTRPSLRQPGFGLSGPGLRDAPRGPQAPRLRLVPGARGAAAGRWEPRVCHCAGQVGGPWCVGGVSIWVALSARVLVPVQGCGQPPGSQLSTPWESPAPVLAPPWRPAPRAFREVRCPERRTPSPTLRFPIKWE